MKPPAFEVHQPRDLGRVFDLLAQYGDDARVLAGGQSLVALMNLRLSAPPVLIDLNRLEGLAGIRREGNAVLIGAMTRQQKLLTDPLIASDAPLLHEALRHVGHVQTRSRGTIGGSLVHADPSAELPLTTVVLGGEITLRSARGTRTVEAQAFFRDALTTIIEPNEILTEVRIPVAAHGSRCAFREFSRRRGDFAIAAAAAQWSPAQLFVGFGGVAAVPRFCSGVAQAFAAGERDRAALYGLAGEEVDSVLPLSDIQASGEYRRTLAKVALSECLDRVVP